MKKILTCALAFALCFSMCLGVMAEAYGTGKTRTVMPISEDVPESAEQNEENRLKAVLTAVKTAVDIPEEYTEFDYDLYTRYEEETWNLMWRNEDYTKTISVNADSEGKITLYNNTIHNMPIKAPLIRRSEALETAYKFIDRVYPGITDSLKEEEIYGTYFGSGTYQFNFVREENGITYAGDNVNISVDYTDGTVRSMYINWDPELEFASPEGVIAPNAAQKIWKNDSEMQLKYRIFNIYDADGNIESAEGKLIYLNAESQKNINAFDGEYYVKDYSWADKNTSSDMIFGVTNESASAAPEEAENGSVKFNENELKKMEELASYVTIENADRNLRSYKQFAIDDTYTLSSYSTGYFYRPYTVQEDRPIVWNLVYTAPVKEGEFYTTTARATVDAQSGEVLSFSTYIEYPWFDGEGNFAPTERKISDDEAKEIAAELLEKLQPEKFEDLAFVSATPYNKFTYTAENYGKQDKEKDGSYYTALRISYERTENGIPVIGNNANITVDCVSGKITQYSLTWTEEVDFADTEAKINPAEAVNAYFENGNTSLVYVMHTVYLYDEAAESDSAEKLPVKPVYSEIKTRNETRLVYNFSAPFYAISAVSGKALNYDGEEYVKAETESFDGFSDISGHWAEEKINLLSDIGVVLSADTFEPDAYITQKEFIAMLMACRNHYSEIYRLEDIDSQLESFVNDMKRSGYYIPEKDEDINPDSTLMRKDAAKFIMRALGYETVATIPGIFTTDFIDNAEIDPQYMGYAALAKGLGIINGSHGRFNGDQSITKAESVILVYNYLNAEK